MLLYPAFFLSGAVALVYQVLWTRQLGLVFGVTIQAASTVLACFMAGLAIGSYVAGRRSDRLTNPLRAFAWIEALIALSALATPIALASADSLFVRIAPGLEGAPVLTTVARAGFSALVLIVPAALMGMTYPIVLRSVARGPEGIRRHASLLYAVNTTGAIAGVLAASLWLVPTFGLRRTFLIGASLNLLVASAAWLMSRGSRSEAASDAASAPPDTSAPAFSPVSDRARLAVLVVIAMSGAVSLALEIVWFRVLVFFLRPTTYAFASMLAAVLAGLAIGSYLITPWLRRRANWLAVLGVVEIGIGLLGLLSAMLLVRGSDVMVWLLEALTVLPRPYDFVVPLFAAAAFAILPTAVLLGAAFPLGLLLWTTREADADGHTGRRVGTLYALNVGGAIVGSLAAGFLLIPRLGAQHSLILITALPLAGGLTLIWMAGTRWRLPGVVLAGAAFVLIALSLPDVFRLVIAERYRGYDVISHLEDAQASVSVLQRGSGRTLLIDGMHHASDGSSMAGYHRAIGALAVSVHPDPRNILIVGMGGGTTAGGAAILPNSRTTVVELSPSVIASGRFFEGINRRILDNPTVTFRVADGRHFLKTTRERFDVITADLMLPQLAGAASLYSADYFVLASRALAPGGIMVQWIPTDAGLQHKLMLRSFVSAFPHVSLWMNGGIAIGSNDPIVLRPSAHALKLAFPQVRAALDEVGLGTFDALAAQYFANRQQIERYLGRGARLEDDRPVVEYFLSLPRDIPPADLEPFRSSVDEIMEPRP